jgi:hypothetical protein
MHMPLDKGTWCHRVMGVTLALTLFSAAAWALPPTQDLKGVVVGSKGTPLADARCTVKGVGLRAEGIEVTTDEHGRFDFPGLQPGQYDLSCAAVGHMPVTENGIKVNPSNPLVLQVVLPTVEKLHQTVEVHEQATSIPAESATPARHVTSQQLNALPLVQEQFMAALPLVPGVLRTPDGKINIKGSGESQGMLLANSTEMVDPITGSYSIDLPVDAIESVEVSIFPAASPPSLPNPPPTSGILSCSMLSLDSLLKTAIYRASPAIARA